MYESFLRKIPLFAELPEDDLSQLCSMISEVRLKAGETLFKEGDPADMAFIVNEGELEVFKQVEGREILLDVQRLPGIVIGEGALLEESTRLATIRAKKPSLLLGLSRFQIQELLRVSQTASRIMLKTLMVRARNIEAHVRHDERMSQLGTMTAGMAHELNNPAAAVIRSAAQLRQVQLQVEATRTALERSGLSAAQQSKLEALMAQVLETAVNPPVIDALRRSDQEAALEDWLEEQGVEEGWTYTAVLAALGLNPADLTPLAADFSAEQFPRLLGWLTAVYTNQLLLTEISQGAERIVDIVRAMKSYVYLDQAPVQNIDIHTGLDDTLAVLANRIPAGVTVEREYSAGLPPITAYGSDLNQVWTNLIANALDAVAGQGEIIIRTRQEHHMALVEIEDNGPGIAPEILPKIFGPFFTTKPPGKGTGLGLTMSFNIVAIHQGTIQVSSENGRTVFAVRLPLLAR